MLQLNLSHLRQTLSMSQYQDRLIRIHEMIEKRNAPGGDYLGWNRWPSQIDQQDIELIQQSAQYIRSHFDILVITGIGGSYLGARAVIDALNGLFPKKPSLEIIYLGQTFSPTYTAQVLNYLKGKRFAINVISKSGTTTETSISFRLLKSLLEKQLPKADVKKAIFATTDPEKGALRELSLSEGYTMFKLPEDIGGRYSVLTAVGLLPIACAGIDIRVLLQGAQEAMELYSNPKVDNLVNQYAVARDVMFKSRAVEMFVTYEPQYAMIAEWLKQLFGESEGKENKGLLPASVNFSTDLHSLGQFIQDGTPVLFETVLFFKKPQEDVVIPSSAQDGDGLNYLAGKTLSFVNEKAFLGTLEAHTQEGHVPVITLTSETLDTKTLGHLLYFFMKVCAVSGYLLGINPFNQPGVEVYKRNMFRLLGKKGY